MKPKGAKNVRQRGMWQLPPYASKLIRQHRDAARADHAYAQALREQTLYPQRVEALIAGRSWYEGRCCSKCESIKRRVYDNSCWTCQKARTNFAVDEKGRCVTRWEVKLSRDGYEARLSEKRREAAGEYIEHQSGEWSAREFPGGKLAVRCARYNIDSQDFRTVPGTRVFELCKHHLDLLNLLRQAGWSI